MKAPERAPIHALPHREALLCRDDGMALPGDRRVVHQRDALLKPRALKTTIRGQQMPMMKASER